MLDAAAGASSADAFWASYAATLLPPPGSLTLPVVLRDDALDALQDEDVAGAARAQRQRLADLLPSLAGPLSASPHTLAWGFAAVRSRAFALGGDAFACVPFADLANHAAQPSADLLQPFDDDGNVVPTGDAATDALGPRLRLVARKALAAGEEVTICYSGAEGSGYTNARFMAQHGFVPFGGSLAERLPLTDAAPPGAAPLCLEWVQESLGDAAWLDMLMGGDTQLYAALSSLPTLNELLPPTPEALAGQAATAGALRSHIAAAIAALQPGADADAEALHAADAAGDEHMAAALRYRLERKRLWARADAVLRDYQAALAVRSKAAQAA
jgi:hypothetical protein